MRTVDFKRSMGQWSAHPEIRVTIKQGTGLRKDFIIAATDGHVNWTAGIGTWLLNEIIPARRTRKKR